MKLPISAIILLFLFAGCTTNDHKSTFTIEGQLVDGTNPTNKFSFHKLKIQNELNHKEIKVLGETTTDKEGNFKFSYEFDDNYKINYMRIVLDSTFIGKSKLSFLELGSSWNKKFYLGDSAKMDIYVNTELKTTDTLYVSNSDSIYRIIGPYYAGKTQSIKCINFTQNGLIGYGVSWSNFYKSQRLVNYKPTVEPMVDEILLDIKY